MHMLEQGNGPGPSKVTPTSAVEEIKELPLPLVGILVNIHSAGQERCLEQLVTGSLPEEHLSHTP